MGLTVGACSGVESSTSTPSPGGPRRITTDTQPRDAYPAAQIAGHLEGERRDADPLCLFVVSNGSKVYLVWPKGYSASATGTQILRADGSTAALVGTFVTLGGGTWALGRAADDACPPHGERWMVAP